MTCPWSENAVSDVGMKHLNPAYIGGTVIVAIMPLAVCVVGANACHDRPESGEKSSMEAPQKTDVKAEVEA